MEYAFSSHGRGIGDGSACKQSRIKSDQPYGQACQGGNQHSCTRFLDCSRVVPVITMYTEDILLAVAWRVELQRMPEGTESRSQHGRPGPNGSPCSNEEV